MIIEYTTMLAIVDGNKTIDNVLINQVIDDRFVAATMIMMITCVTSCGDDVDDNVEMNDNNWDD